MAINERLIDTEVAAAADGGAASAEQNLILHLDANDVDSYDGDGSIWYDISEHDITIPLSSDDSDNLKIHYNPSDSNSYSGTGTTLTNLAGSSLNATVVASRFDIDNGGFFDISTDGEQSIVIPSGHPLNGEFTLEFWFKFQSTPSQGNRFIYDLGETAFQFFFYQPHGWRFYQAGGGKESGYYGSGTIEVGKWQHKVITFTSTGSFKAYIDGELIKSASWTRVTTSLGAFDFGSTDITADKPKCDIGAIRMYDKTLSASEVGQNYRHGRDYIYTDLIDDTNLALHFDAADLTPAANTTWTDKVASLALTKSGTVGYDDELGDFIDWGGGYYGNDTATNQIKDSNGDYVIEFWINFDTSNSATNSIVGFMQDASNRGLILSYSSSGMACYNYKNGTMGGSQFAEPTWSNLGITNFSKWYHVTVVIDASTSIRFYIDGQLKFTSTSNAGGSQWNNLDGMRLGSSETVSSYQSNGHLGQIRFYKGLLTETQILQNYVFTKNNYPSEIHFTGNNISSADWNSSGYFDLDGSTEYFETSGNPSALINATNFTFQTWVKMHTTGTQDYIASQTSANGGTQNWLLRFHTDNTIRFYVYGTDRYLSTTSTYSANTWYHIAGVIEADGIVKIYVNGTLERFSGSGKSADTISYNTFIGSLGGSSNGRFDGNIGAVKYYSKALTASELLADYNATKSTYGL